MTQEEKAKAYDEAIKKLRSLHEDYNTVSTLIDVKEELEEIFPELKESDGEVMRKKLLELVAKHCGKTCEMYLWLEKQGEQKPTTKLEYDENGEPILTSFEAELFSVISEVWQGYLLGEEVNIAKIVKEHSAELLERANEQNPVVYDKDAEKASEEYRNFRMSCGIKDPVMLNEIEEAYYEGAIRKQKPAWSGEEEENIDGICYLITENCDAEKASELITWLKSLKERYAWKPSDEQMNTLEHYMHTLICTKHKEVLFGLYDDLKKLREG